MREVELGEENEFTYLLLLLKLNCMSSLNVYCKIRCRSPFPYGGLISCFNSLHSKNYLGFTKEAKDSVFTRL